MRGRRENLSFLSFLPRRERPAGREAYRPWSIKKSSVPKYFLETTIHFCHKRINWWTEPNLFYNFFICNVSEKSFSKLEFLIIWPWHGKSREVGSIGFSGNWNANFWSLENVCSLYVRYMYAYQIHTVICNKTVEENKITHIVYTVVDQGA